MKLKELLEKVPQIKIDGKHPALETEITGLSTNSQTCQPGDLFLGMPGTKVDGGDFWASAIASGAVAALVSPTAQAKSNINNACVIASD
ncbi:MAG: Mur ligase domain-containing protein, partial [Microcoleaceae cyanobacterium]